ncbi:MAG: nuclear transport factor 2 family protein [bacterium]|nr:nuclear transport factor 2 family protein [bacterium]
MSRFASPAFALMAILGLTVAVTSRTTATEESASEDPRARVEAAEHRLNQAARQRDRQGFHDLLARDSVFLAGELHSGRLAVMAIWQHLFDGKYDFRYEAEMLETTVASSGDLAWSVGTARTSFRRPGTDSDESTDGHYLHVWRPDDEGAWRLTHASTLVVHPTLGAARDPRGGLMTAWPELADQIGARIEIRWIPEATARAESDELAFSFGEYEATFVPAAGSPGEAEPAAEPSTTEPDAGSGDDAKIAGKGHFLAVWQKDDRGNWQLAAEGFTPPGIYDGD